MIALVSVEDVKARLRIETNDDDDNLESFIYAASKAVMNYLKGQADALLDLTSAGDLPSGAEVPQEIQMATTLLVGILYRNTDTDPEKMFADGNTLPAPVAALLYQLRDPALA